LYRLLSYGFAQNNVILVSAPAGSGKTILLKSWLDAAGLSMRAAWVTVDRGDSSAQNFWRCVIEALKGTLGAELLRLTPTPDFDGNALISRLLSEVSSLEEPLVLVIDDLQEPKSSGAGAAGSPGRRRRPFSTSFSRPAMIPGSGSIVCASPRTNWIRSSDLRFNLGDGRLTASGIYLSVSTRVLQERTEGWAAGLRAGGALSPHRRRFVAEFSGGERMVADYLLAGGSGASAGSRGACSFERQSER
jgi:LuxR family maltose regulon positive regulatory protein